jgi:hypothetical protein
MCGNEKPEGVCTPTTEWGDLNQLRELAEKIKGNRTALRAALKRLDEELTPSFAGAGVKVAYLAWSIQKHKDWWGIWYCPEDSDNLSGDPDDRFAYWPLKTIGDAPHEDLMAFVEGEGAELLSRYVAALRANAPQIGADVEKMEKVLSTLSP